MQPVHALWGEIAASTVRAVSETRPSSAQEALRDQVGMWLFVASDLVGFVALLSTLMALGAIGSSRWQLPVVALLSVLVAALLQIAARRDGRALLFVLTSAVLASMAALVSAHELSAFVDVAELSRQEEAHAALLGFHSLHLLGGVIALIRACFTRSFGLALALYWSFVAVLGLVILVAGRLG